MLDPQVLEGSAPVGGRKRVVEIAFRFGGSAAMLSALDELSPRLYEPS